MEDNTSAKFEFLASFILPESILDWFDFIKSREDEVLNYFINHSTNAGAESLNSKIKTFRSQLRGVSDYPFFMYRIYKIFG